MLIALHKETSIHQPSEALIRNLLATNLCVVFVAYWISIHSSQPFANQKMH